MDQEFDEKAERTFSISTHKKTGSYFVAAGSADIYVACRAVNIGSERKENAIYLCSIGAGETFPALHYKDSGNTYWYFLIKGEENQDVVEERPKAFTEEEKLSFLSRTPAAAFAYDDSLRQDNRFCDSLASWYEVEDMRADAQEPQEPQPQETNCVMLHHADEVLCRDSEGSYVVQSGSVNVFVGSAYSTNTHKLFCICTIPAGGAIPAFGFRDAGSIRWYLKLVAAKNSAVLIKRQNSASEKEISEFLAIAGLKIGSGEEYSNAIIDWYNTKLLKRILISDGKGKKRESLNNISLDKHFVKGTIPIYKAVSYACFYHKIAHLSEEDTKICCGNEELTIERIAEASHFICRRVVLEEGWWNTDCGPIIGFLDKSPVACVKKGNRQYTVYYGSESTMKEEKLTAEIAEQIDPEAYSIGRTLPEKKLSQKDILEFCKSDINRGDVWTIVIFGAVSALIGILLPTLNQKLYDDYIPLGNYSQLIQLCVVIASFMLGNLFFGIVKNISEYRIGSRAGYDLQNAAIYRAFYLPEKFFREHESAELSQYILQIDEVATSYSNLIVVSGLSSIFSCIYLVKMFNYTAKLSWAALGMLAAYTALIYFLSARATEKEKAVVAANGEANVRIYQFLRAIDKIRMAGAEERAVFRYLLPVRDREVAKIQKEKLLSLTSALQGSVITIFSMVLYYMMVKKSLDITVGNFTAFNSALGSFASSILSLVSALIEVKRTKPVLDRIMPVFEEEPEYFTEKGKELQPVAGLNGAIEIEDVGFSYSQDGPAVLKNLNMSIQPGDYVGIVGKSGSGKSTLLKLLLGFEKPTSGRILIDGKNLTELDKKSYRRKLGVVLQNGKLIEGSIQENITITAPNAKLADVKRVIKDVGLEQDVKNMPMGINTMLSENAGTISGGQQQRILIARALVGQPKLLLFDEATSALDNITQKIVYETIDKIQATKIVIAHRLSTIQNCNKIFVLDGGKIVEMGNYESLMKANGLFAEMAARQLIDGEADDD